MNNLDPTLSIATLLGGSTKAMDWTFGNIQRPPLNVHSVLVRMAGMLMTWSVLGGLEVSPGVPVTRRSALTATSQGEKFC